MELKVKTLAKHIGVNTRVRTRYSLVCESLKTAAQFNIDLPGWYDVFWAAQMLVHLVSTGRVQPGVVCNVREMSDYRVVKLVHHLACCKAQVELEKDAIDIVNAYAA
jgi:hypothetical protein